MHKPVLLQEVITALAIQPGDVVVDGTVGGGGYLMKICEILNSQGVIIGFDQDSLALQEVKKKLSQKNNKQQCRIELVNENFRKLNQSLDKLKINKVDKIVFDLGISSNQLEQSGRGFSFQRNEPLLMTLKKDLTEDDLTAEKIVNEWGEQTLIDIFVHYGEERFAKRIAREIIKARKIQPIKTTFDLAHLIERATPLWYQKQKKHFATKIFQALRITVNDELTALQEGLTKGFDCLNINGRLAVVSFHSKEDRLVKIFFKEKKKVEAGKILTKKPIVPTQKEVKNNPRSRSAKLRVIEKIK